MMDLFRLDKKREDKIHSEVLDRVIRGIKQVKKNGKLRLSRDRVVSAITIALMSRDQHNTVIGRNGTFDVSPKQILSMYETDGLKDKGPPETCTMTMIGKKCT